MTPEEKQENYELAEKLLYEQNFDAAFVVGVAATILSAATYAVITLAAGGSANSLLAVGIGVAIGGAIQFLGRGIAAKFSIFAAVLAVIGCVLGKVFAVVIYSVKAMRISFFDVPEHLDLFSIIVSVFSSLSLINLIFWIVAAGSASYFAKRRLSYVEARAIRLHETRRGRWS